MHAQVVDFGAQVDALSTQVADLEAQVREMRLRFVQHVHQVKVVKAVGVCGACCEVQLFQSCAPVSIMMFTHE